MKKNLFFGIALCVLTVVAGCQQELSDRLMGKWQLKSIEQQGVVTRVDTVWYNFQSQSLFMYQIYLAGEKKYIHQYGYKTQPDENTVQLQLITYGRSAKEFLLFTDWEEPIRTFTVQKATSDQLILRCKEKTYTLIPF